VASVNPSRRSIVKPRKLRPQAPAGPIGHNAAKGLRNSSGSGESGLSKRQSSPRGESLTVPFFGRATTARAVRCTRALMPSQQPVGGTEAACGGKWRPRPDAALDGRVVPRRDDPHRGAVCPSKASEPSHIVRIRTYWRFVTECLGTIRARPSRAGGGAQVAGRRRLARWSSKTGQWSSRGAQIAERACWCLSTVTGSEAENVTALERSGDGTWKITVELLELPRMPETLDLIGSYETELDEEGKLLGYRRLRQYPRDRGGREDSVDAEQQPGRDT
jgi:hypothetical protein